MRKQFQVSAPPCSGDGIIACCDPILLLLLRFGRRRRRSMNSVFHITLLSPRISKLILSQGFYAHVFQCGCHSLFATGEALPSPPLRPRHRAKSQSSRPSFLQFLPIEKLDYNTKLLFNVGLLAFRITVVDKDLCLHSWSLQSTSYSCFFNTLCAF